MDSLTRRAYIIYIVHWVFVIWLQKAMLGIEIHPGTKALTVFGTSLLLSWMVARVSLAIPVVRKIL